MNFKSFLFVYHIIIIHFAFSLKIQYTLNWMVCMLFQFWVEISLLSVANNFGERKGVGGEGREREKTQS